MADTYKEYEKTEWRNNLPPDLDADHLNKIEKGIADASKEIVKVNSDLKKIFPDTSYSIYDNTFKSFDNLVTTQIANISIGNDGSEKTPTGKDGILLVFALPSFRCVQMFFDWSGSLRHRIKWSTNWGQWF